MESNKQPKDFKLCLFDPDYLKTISNIKPEEYELSGSIEIIKLLQQSMRTEQNQIQTIRASDILGGQIPECDVVFGNWITTNTQYETFPYDYNYVTFFARKPPYQRNDWAIMGCFSLNVWICLLISVIFVSLIFYALFRKQVTVGSAAFYIATSTLGSAHDWRPRSEAQKTVVLFWNLGLTVLIFSYTSVLLSFLTIPKTERGLKTVDDVYQALKEGRVKAREFRSKGVGQLLANLHEEKTSFIGKFILNQTGIDFMTGNLERNDAVFGMRTQIDIHFDSERHNAPSDSVLNFWYVGSYMTRVEPFRDLYGEEINRHILRTWSAGLMRKFIDRASFKAHLKVRNSVEPQDSPVKPLSLESLSGAFHCLIFGHVLSVLVLVVEILSKRCLRKPRI